MDWGSIVVALISAVSLVWVAMIQTHTGREKARTERRAARRAEESSLQMKMQAAGIKLALVTAKKLNGGHTNGDVEEAMREAHEAQEAYENFLLHVAAEQTTKV